MGSSQLLKRWIKEQTNGFNTGILLGGKQKRLKHIQTINKIYLDIDSEVPESEVVVIVDGLDGLGKRAGNKLISILKNQSKKIIIFCSDKPDGIWKQLDFERKQFEVERVKDYHKQFGEEGDGLFCVWNLKNKESYEFY